MTQAISIAAQVAEGLGYAHEHGVVHRDIKPANIMVVPNGPVKITDFGIARMRASSHDLTQTGMMLGSPKYMSPEQVIGKRADHRSDIFSLGVILYEMLCRRDAVQRRERHRAHVPDRQLRAAGAEHGEPRGARAARLHRRQDARQADRRALPGRARGGARPAPVRAQLGVNVNATQPPMRGATARASPPARSPSSR